MIKFFCLVTLLFFINFPAAVASETWHTSASNSFSNKFSSLNQINRSNIKGLSIAWKSNAGFKPWKAIVEATPILAKDVLITSNQQGFIIGLDPSNGKEIWRTQLPIENPTTFKGMSYFDDNLLVPTSKGVYFLNPVNGAIKKEFGKNGVVGDEETLVPPYLKEDKLFIAYRNSRVAAYEINSGKLLWSTSLIKNNVEARIWNSFSFDPELNILFVGTSNPKMTDVHTGREAKDTGYANSLIAINSLSGQVIWSFQTVFHDVWNLDMLGNPILVDFIDKNGEKIPAVVGLGKVGTILFLNRVNGDFIFEENAGNFINTPLSQIKDENISSIQPEIVKPKRYSSLFFNLDNISNLSKQKNLYLKFKTRNAKSGYFLPPSLKYDLALFGPFGTPAGGSLNPKRNILVVPSSERAWLARVHYINTDAQTENQANSNKIYKEKCMTCHQADFNGIYMHPIEGDQYFPSLAGITLLKSKSNLTSLQNFKKNHQYLTLDSKITDSDLKDLYYFFRENDRSAYQKNKLRIISNYQQLIDQEGAPGSNPPWGYLSAYDMKNGERLWRIPYGITNVKFHDGTVKSFRGAINEGGISIFEDIIFATGTYDKRAYAFDLLSGKELWRSDLSSHGSAPPMTYYYKGCQYIVFNATGVLFGKVSFYGNLPNDETVAFKLKECVPH